MYIGGDAYLHKKKGRGGIKSYCEIKLSRLTCFNGREKEGEGEREWSKEKEKQREREVGRGEDKGRGLTFAVKDFATLGGSLLASPATIPRLNTFQSFSST